MESRLDGSGGYSDSILRCSIHDLGLTQRENPAEAYTLYWLDLKYRCPDPQTSGGSEASDSTLGQSGMSG